MPGTLATPSIAGMPFQQQGSQQQENASNSRNTITTEKTRKKQQAYASNRKDKTETAGTR
jgi:hypothetical protein